VADAAGEGAAEGGGEGRGARTVGAGVGDAVGDGRGARTGAADAAGEGRGVGAAAPVGVGDGRGARTGVADGVGDGRGARTGVADGVGVDLGAAPSRLQRLSVRVGVAVAGAPRLSVRVGVAAAGAPLRPGRLCQGAPGDDVGAPRRSDRLHVWAFGDAVAAGGSAAGDRGGAATVLSVGGSVIVPAGVGAGRGVAGGGTTSAANRVDGALRADAGRVRRTGAAAAGRARPAATYGATRPAGTLAATRPGDERGAGVASAACLDVVARAVGAWRCSIRATCSGRLGTVASADRPAVVTVTAIASLPATDAPPPPSPSWASSHEPGIGTSPRSARRRRRVAAAAARQCSQPLRCARTTRGRRRRSVSASELRTSAHGVSRPSAWSASATRASLTVRRAASTLEASATATSS
jgi:hypothetical protein